MNICVYGAASSEIDQSFIEAGEELGRKLVERGHSLVFGGGANGMMGAVARGVHEKGGYILGVAPAFFNVDGVSYDECNEFIHTDTMRERKRVLEEKSDAFIIAPGGIGTFDEFYEILTLKQLGRHNKPIVIWNLNNYYDHMGAMLQVSVEKHFITDDTVKLCKAFFDNIDGMLDYIENYDPTDIDLSRVKIR